MPQFYLRGLYRWAAWLFLLHVLAAEENTFSTRLLGQDSQLSWLRRKDVISITVDQETNTDISLQIGQQLEVILTWMDPLGVGSGYEQN